MRRAAVLLPLALLTGCGLSREARIEAKLEKAGLKPALARCVARRLDERLSDAQLAALAEAVRPPPGGGRLHRRAIAARVAAIDDPQLASTVAGALLGCSVLG